MKSIYFTEDHDLFRETVRSFMENGPGKAVFEGR